MRKILLLLIVLAVTVPASAQNEEIVIGKTVAIYSKVLNEERKVMISLPSDYEGRNEEYPVVYVLDARRHFLHTTTSARFLSDLNMAPGLIVVAVINTIRNRDMTTPDPECERFKGNGGAEEFASFIGSELIPFIDANYRTQNYKILVGHSLAGFFTFYVMLNHPNLFDSYIATSPSLWWKEEQLVNQMEQFIERGDSLNKFLYFASCRERLVGIITSVNNVLKTLESQAPPGLRWKYEYMPEEIHSSIPNRAIYEGLEFIFDGWSFNSTAKNADAEKMRIHFASLSEIYGFKCRPAEMWMNLIGYESLNSGRIPEAIDYFKYYVEMYPNSANAYGSLAEAYLKVGEKEAAIANYEKTVELNPDNQNALKMLKKIRDGKE